jgi:hypothetical protein
MTQRCPSCLALVDPDAQASCPVCGYGLSAAPAADLPEFQIIEKAKRVRIQADVCLGVTADCTESSKAFAIGIPLIISFIVTQVSAIARSLMVSLQMHKDLEVDDPAIQLVLDRAEPALVAQAVSKLEYSGGGDSAETHLDAIATLANTVPCPTAGGARSAIVAICNADTKPLRDGRSPAALGAELKERGILLYLVCETFPAFEELARAAGGLIIPISNSPSEKELNVIAHQVAASLSMTLSTRSLVPLQVPAPSAINPACGEVLARLPV